jgi:hypothetical protein
VDHLEHLHDNVAHNELDHCMRVTELEWAQHDTDAFRRRCSAPFDWILASDCVYEEDSHGPLARTVSAFSDTSTLVLMSQECRSEVHTSFFRRATTSSYDGAQRRDTGGGEEEDVCMLPQLNRLIEDSFVRDEISASNVDTTAVPSQHRLTQQILSHWQPFQDLKLMFAGSLRAEQLSLRSQQRVVATR